MKREKDQKAQRDAAARKAETAAAAAKSRQRLGGPPAAGAPQGKTVDAGAGPCHAQVYRRQCAKSGCPFDHDAGRVAAYKAKYPDKPPARG